MHIREEPGLTDGMIHICNMKSNIPVVQRLAHPFHHILQEEILSLYNMKNGECSSIFSTSRNFNSEETINSNLCWPCASFMVHQISIRDWEGVEWHTPSAPYYLASYTHLFFQFAWHPRIPMYIYLFSIYHYLYLSPIFLCIHLFHLFLISVSRDPGNCDGGSSIEWLVFSVQVEFHVNLGPAKVLNWLIICLLLKNDNVLLRKRTLSWFEAI
jgi:hypothetical protein